MNSTVTRARSPSHTPLSTRVISGLGNFGERDPRVTLAVLAHPGLLSVAATRLVGADILIDSRLTQVADEMNRSRLTYLMAAVIVVFLGLASRKYASAFPEFIGNYAGDTLWALMVFLGIGMLFPGWSTRRVCVTALLFAFAIELSQLYHSPWIDQIRRTMAGGFVLGYGFLWSDLLCYVVGISIGCTLEALLTGLNARRRQPDQEGSSHGPRLRGLPKP